MLLPRLGLLLACCLWLAACTGLPPARPEPSQFIVAAQAEGRWFRNHDNLTLFGQWWHPAESPKGVILLVHATALHSGFYAPWTQELMRQGYAVFALDLRGWGQSQGFGRRGYVRSYDEYVDDLALAYREVKSRYPDTPFFLQGEAMGAAVVLLADITGRIESQGLILNAPLLPQGLGLEWLQSPGLALAWLLGGAGQLAPNFPALPSWDSVNSRRMFLAAEARQRFLQDPANTHTALPAAYLSSLDEASRRIRHNLVNLRRPFIILQGETDHWAASGSETLLRTASSLDKSIKRYPGLAHAALHDRDCERVWADIVVWLDARTQKMTLPAEDIALIGAR